MFTIIRAAQMAIHCVVDQDREAREANKAY